MTEIVEIESVSSGIIKAVRPSARSSSSRRFWGVQEKPFALSNPDNIFILPGYRVEIELPAGVSMASSFMLFIFPLLMFGLIFWLTGLIFPGWGEGIRTVISLAGIGVSLWFNGFLFRKSLPVIRQRIEGEEPPVCGCDSCKGCG